MQSIERPITGEGFGWAGNFPVLKGATVSELINDLTSFVLDATPEQIRSPLDPSVMVSATVVDGVPWLRSVAAHPKKRYPNRQWVFWQYSGTGLSKGHGTEIDLNVFNGSIKGWHAWLGKNIH